MFGLNWVYFTSLGNAVLGPATVPSPNQLLLIFEVLAEMSQFLRDSHQSTFHSDDTSVPCPPEKRIQTESFSMVLAGPNIQKVSIENIMMEIKQISLSHYVLNFILPHRGM